MIDRKDLLADLQKQQKKLVDDLLDQVKTQLELKASLEAEYKQARDAGRTAETFGAWSEEQITQAAVAWILACVFLRFIEDNGLIDTPMLSGSGDALRRAKGSYEIYFGQHPTNHDRHYLEHCFDQLVQFPAVAGLYDRDHNPLFRLPLSYDAAKALVEFWQRVDPDSGELIHDFRDPELNTRFLGDLYQDLSDAAKKRYALLQTPEFVEEFILDRTLDPAIETFGLVEVRMIDPTCGSGHFVLGGFARLLARWEKESPGLDAREHTKRALAGVYGVDLNPFAVAIARFRLLVAALQATGIKTLRDAPGWQFNLTTGDSLLHGKRFGELDLGSDALEERFAHAYSAEDRDEIDRILGQQYHAVVGNPPYITVKNKALSQLYRAKYSTCHRKYSLGVPFTERFFRLTLPSSEGRLAGFTGLITTNSFMKREFGKKLIELFLPNQDLTHVIDTSGAYIPGHGTPTVILLGRHSAPKSQFIRAALGIQGEPSIPKHPAQGRVWTSIIQHIDDPEFENEFISVSNISRSGLASHPWSLTGGSAPSVLNRIETATDKTLDSISSGIGVCVLTGEDDVFVTTPSTFARTFSGTPRKTIVLGDTVRDWATSDRTCILYPIDISDIRLHPTFQRHVWKYRATLGTNIYFGKSREERGLRWFDYTYWSDEKLTGPLITFSDVATHNHFVFNDESSVFNQTSPVIKLTNQSTRKDYLGLTGLLNSSTACFWLKQVCHNKGSTVDSAGARQTTVEFENFYQLASTRVKQFPLAAQAPYELSAQISDLAKNRCRALAVGLSRECAVPQRKQLDDLKSSLGIILHKMIALQEELDWWCYRAYDLIEDDFTFSGEAPEISLGERAFEIMMARRMSAGEFETTWFARHGSTPVTELPDRWPEDYANLVRRRIELIESNPWIGLLERPEYKRRWNQPCWEEMEQEALNQWLLDRLETERYWTDPQLKSLDELQGIAERDEDFMAVARLYTGQTGFDLRALLRTLLDAESVPALRALRYKPAGLRKRADWERTWILQRREDEIDAEVAASLKQEDEESDADFTARVSKEQKRRKAAEIGDIPAPPKYKGSDFLKPSYWKLRLGLDVPKERFFCIPDADQPGAWLYGWAGWNAAERVRAIAGKFTDAETRRGWPLEGLMPLLIAVHEELAWVLQWHNAVDDETGVRMGDYFRAWLGEQLQRHGLTTADLDNWTPPAPARGRRRARAAAE